MSPARNPRSSALAISEIAPVFAALGDPTRLHLVTRLSADGPLSIARLSEGPSLTRQAITKHLLLLEGAGVVRSAKEGRERIWEIEPSGLLGARRCLENVSAMWDDALERLRSFVETNED